MKHLTASCPLLEELAIEYCYGFKKFCLYGLLQNLKKARFFYNGEKGFGGIDIEAPNICEFQLGKVGRGAISVKLGLYKQKLRRFLEKSDRFKVLNLANNICRKISVDFKQLKGIQSQPYELEHVELREGKTNDLQFVDGILWCCRPRSLSWTSEFSSISDKERSHILQLPGRRRKEGPCQRSPNVQEKKGLEIA
ncbi:hypothetical protein Tco_0086038 [Tanacetum coccineum]